jgi:hypothetical protein
MVEGLENNRLIHGIVPIAALTLTGLILSGAFSDRVRKLIRARDHDCQWQTGEGHAGILEAAHLNHNHSYPQYNSPENGRLLCTKHHLADHESGRQTGLNAHQNNWAINALRNRLNRFMIDDILEP